MKYFVVALIIGLVVFKVFFSDAPTINAPKINAPQDLGSAPEVPTSGGEMPLTPANPESNSPGPESLTPETGGVEIPDSTEINPANRIMIDQASPAAAAGIPSGKASSVTEGIGIGTGSPLKQGEGVKLDPSSLFFDKGSHSKIFGNEGGGGSPEAKGQTAGVASAISVDQGSPVLNDKSSLTKDVPVE